MSVNLGELATSFNMNQVEQNRFSGHPQQGQFCESLNFLSRTA